MERINIATVCDKNYLVRAITLYRSVITYMPKTKVWFLCMDQETKNILEKLNLENTFIRHVDEINDYELIDVRNTRSNGEFAMTSKASWIRYIEQSSYVKDGDSIIYMDADMLLFSSLESLIEKMENGKYSIGITPHRFTPNQIDTEIKVGKYNSGFEIFIIDDNSRACINNWRKQCIDWCYLKEDKGRLGDQKYLNDWKSKFNGVYEILDKGINAGSWNLINYKISERNEVFFIDDSPIICYHFHRIKFYIAGENIRPLPVYIYHKKLYKVYTELLLNSWKMVKKIDSDWKFGFEEKPNFLKLIKQKITRYIKNINQNSNE